MKKLIVLLSALLAAASLSAQEGNGVPEDVFYLMPKFGDGMVVYQGKAPVRGTFNICAIDGTVRFKDKSGQELAADDEGLLEVVIDGVTFVRNDENFVRIYPLPGETSLAVKRNVLIMNDSKTGSYGMASQTTAVTEYSGVTSNGRMYNLEELKEFPYRMSETIMLYKDKKLTALTKKNLQKAFPDYKDGIEALYAKNKNPKLDDLLGLLKSE